MLLKITKIALLALLTTLHWLSADSIPEFSFDKVNWLHPRVDHWPETKQLSVSMGKGKICFNVDRSSWPEVSRKNKAGKVITPNANAWIFAFHQGQWHGRTWEWWRNEKKCNPMRNMTPGKKAPLTSWKPQKGEVFYVMMSGLIRSKNMRNVEERTNAVKIIWPGESGSARFESVNASTNSNTGNQDGSSGVTNSGNSLPFNLNEVTWLHYPGVKNWPETSKLQVELSANHIHLKFDKTNVWKTDTIRHNSGTKNIEVNANPWVFVELKGKWYAGTFEWMRPGGTTKGRYTVNGDHIKKPPLNDWSPIAGETYYFMVAGLTRGGPNGSHERTNIVGIKWPDGSTKAETAGGIQGGTASSGGSSGASPSGGTSANTQTHTITCMSKKMLGLFSRRRVCGGELFEKLTGYKLVAELGTQCKEGDNWGIHDGHAIWLKGCSAKFEVTGIPKGEAASGIADGTYPQK